MTTTVVNLRHGEPYDVRIDRRTKWGNPFRIEDIRADGHTEEKARLIAVEAFGSWVHGSDSPKARWIREHVHELKDRRLACWCAPPGGCAASDPLVCHGQILARLADGGGA